LLDLLRADPVVLVLVKHGHENVKVRPQLLKPDVDPKRDRLAVY
jgi:hypothetical protein